MNGLGRWLLGAVLMLGLAQVQAAQWRLVKDEAGIRVYLRQVPGSSFQAFRGVTRIRTDMP
ncbi:MAG: lipid-binding protein, partial [Gammaproteobacteria bacterium HGW-Gammaproteobacteria-7]